MAGQHQLGNEPGRQTTTQGCPSQAGPAGQFMVSQQEEVIGQRAGPGCNGMATNLW